MRDLFWIIVLLVSAACSVAALKLIRYLAMERDKARRTPASQNGTDSMVINGGVIPALAIRSENVWMYAALSVEIVILIVLGIKHIANVPVILLHHGVFVCGTMCVDGIAEARRKRRAGVSYTKDPLRKRSHVYAAAGIGCALYLTAAFLNANRIQRTEYVVKTTKDIPNGELCIVQLSDVHLGTTVGEKDFRRLVARIADEKPDMVVITGDLTDRGTKRKLMERCLAELKGLKTRFGIYYVPGNHDSEEGQFRMEELHEELTKNGVVVLSDDYRLTLWDVFVNGSKGLGVIGRKDATVSRESANRLFKRYEESVREQELYSSDLQFGEPRYTILLDHQPNDFAAEAEAGADLVLCGHAHGGFLLPLKWIWKIYPDLIFRVDLCEGRKRIGNTDFIVSSGVGTCLTDFKTGTKSEYVVIRVKQIAGEK